MQKFRISLSVVTTLLALSACGGSNPPPGNDTGPLTFDSGMHPGTDGAVDTGGSTANACASPINLDTAGTALTTGTGRTITQSNMAAPATATGVANASCALDQNGDPVVPTHDVVFSYTVQNGGHLRISTNNPTSDMMLDSVVWALDACTMAATELGCDDDDANDPNGTLLSTALTSSISAGTHVFIVVGGYPTAMQASGTFTLTVSELPTNAVGAACDTTASPFCADGSSCQLDDGAMSAGHCLADGAANGACRLAAPFCDTALVCTETAPTMDTPGTCQMPIATGAACSQDHFVCVTGSTCLRDPGSDTMGHCLADGAEYGVCRITGAACDASLTCSEATPTMANPGICQTPVAAGGACTLDHHFLCVTGYSCQSNDGTMAAGTCLADGSEYGACRTTGTACDTGLTCSATPPTANDTCQMPIAAGGACTPRHSLCVTGNSCVLTSATAGTCNADGSDGAHCRAADPQCDGTLACGPDNVCAAP